jgi:hypothetical protein
MFVSHLNSPMPTWFETVFGFRETRYDYDTVRSRFRVEIAQPSSAFVESIYNNGGSLSGGDVILHTVPSHDETARRFFVGTFDTPSVGNLRSMLHHVKRAKVVSEPEINALSLDTGSSTVTPDFHQKSFQGKGLTFRHIVGNAGRLHRDPKNAGAVFQVASQFNVLEMPSPRVTPDDGVTNYVYDPTQGPNCAIACPAATLYRNYFVNEYGQGGSRGRQLDLLYDVGVALGNTCGPENGTCGSSEHPKYWKVTNGYALPIDATSISNLKRVLENNESIVEVARDCLRVGVHWNTEVEVEGHHTITQVFCSALPIGYHHGTSQEDISVLACLVLDGLYEATLSVASIVARNRGKRVAVFLTCVGGGVFGNEPSWIIQAIDRALKLYSGEPIDVYLVHFGALKEVYLSNIPERLNE